MRIVELSGKNSETLRFIRSLRQKKYRAAARRFLIEGVTLLSEATSAGFFPESVVCSRGASEAVIARTQKLLAPLSGTCYSVPESVFSTLTDERAPQGVIAVLPFLQDAKNSKNIHGSFTNTSARYIILEKIQDPGNAGSMLRSAAAFGYTGALLCDTADVYNPKTVRACMGALFHLELFVFDHIAETLSAARARGLHLYGTSPHAAAPLSAAALKAPFAVLFGNEGAGLSEEALAACDAVFAIPMRGMESLNAAAAAAVVLYETEREQP